MTPPPSQPSVRVDPAAAQDLPEPRLAAMVDVTTTREERQQQSTSEEITCTSMTLSSSVDTVSIRDSSWQCVERPEEDSHNAPPSMTFTGDSHGDMGE